MSQLKLAACLPLLVAGMLGGACHAQEFTSKESLSALFELEGESPFPTPYAGTLNFSALKSKYDSGNGHGYRNELKIAKKQRLGVLATSESFSARVTPMLPNGAKTIVAQYHLEGLDTMLKVYVQDTLDRKALDGQAENGVFDILARITGSDGKEVMTTLGTVRSGDSFALDIRLANGEATVAVKTDKHGTMQTARTRVKDAGRAIYFKFGDYLQALDPETQGKTTERAKWDAYFAAKRIDSSQVSFSGVVFKRDTP
jgi:hypothetical protein